MKRTITSIFAIFLALAMVMSLAACGGGKVQDALQGTWVAKWTARGESISRYYTFKGNKYTTGGHAIMGDLEKETGSFEVKDSSIHLIPDDGSEAKDLDYNFDESSGTITLWWNDDVQFKKGSVDPNY